MTENIPERSEFDSVDPAPPSEGKNISNLRNTLCDENEKMFQRMRALFALRNIGGKESVDALAAAYSSKSALLKEVKNCKSGVLVALGAGDIGLEVPKIKKELSYAH